ncbi:MAG: tetratricopeptide repeat protein [Magnetococcales bacterium]|nr:tetratricopeptide repeat protein [Magnetococcales bacterium]
MNRAERGRQDKLVNKDSQKKPVASISSKEAHSYLQNGVTYHQHGNFVKAIAFYKKCLGIQPDNIAAMCNLGGALQITGALDDAAAVLQKAISIKPDYAGAYNNLGQVKQDQGLLDEAKICFQKAISFNPSFVQAYNNLGNMQQMDANLDRAVACYQKAISLQPNFAQAYNNLGNVLREQGHLDLAVENLQKAISLQPGYAEAYSNLAYAKQEQGKLDEAIANNQKAISLDPDFAEAYSNLGAALKDKGRLEEGIQNFRKAISLKADLIDAHNNLIFCIDAISQATSDMFCLERQNWAKIHAEPLKALWQPHSNKPEPHRKLRIGYVGADFRQHSAANIFGPMLINHNRDKFSIFCYAGNSEEDELTAKFKSVATKWVNTSRMTDEELAAIIRKDEIDILVDLAGHTKGSRLLTYARKPAPIQVTAWGYPHGTGMEAMDYLFADPIFIPVSQRKKYSENIIDLPSVIHLNSDIVFPEPKPPPACQVGYITFGAFNRIVKYNEAVYALWSEILQRIPSAKLLIKTATLDLEKRRQEVVSNFKIHGILPERLILLGKTSKQEHLAAHHLVDIMLDPFPHNGGMTTLESLRMGVPVLTCENMSRCPTSASILNQLGLDEWRAINGADYLKKAIGFADDIQVLQHLREELPKRFVTSVLGDSQLYVNKVEAIYRLVWQKWCVQKHDNVEVMP